MPSLTEFDTKALKESLRRGPYAWPGGYSILYLTSDGETLCSACVRSEFREVVDAIKRNDSNGWRVVAEFVHWEGEADYCAHCNAELASECGPVDDGVA